MSLTPLVPPSDGPLPINGGDQVQVCRDRFFVEGRNALEALLSLQNCQVEAVFYAAASMNMVDCMEYLVTQQSEGMNYDQYIEFSGGDRMTALHGAVKAGSVGATKWLLERGADPNLPFSITVDGQSKEFPPIWEATQHGYLRLVRILLQAGADPNATKSDSGNSALYVACQNGKGAVAAELLNWGAEPHLTGGKAPLEIAVATGNASLVALLCSRAPTNDLVFAGTFNLMFNTWKTAVTSNLARPLTPKEVADLFSLVMVGEKGDTASNILRRHATVGVHYTKSLAAEQAGDYRQALWHMSHAQTAYQQAHGKPPLACHLRKNMEDVIHFCRYSLHQWPQLLLDLKRMVHAVYGPEAYDGRIAMWREYEFDRGTIFPPDLQFYSWSRHGDWIYRYGGMVFLVSE